MSMDPFDIVVSHSTHPSPAVPPAAALQELPELPLPAGAANSPNSLPPNWRALVSADLARLEVGISAAVRRSREASREAQRPPTGAAAAPAGARGPVAVARLQPSTPTEATFCPRAPHPLSLWARAVLRAALVGFLSGLVVVSARRARTRGLRLSQLRPRVVPNAGRSRAAVGVAVTGPAPAQPEELGAALRRARALLDRLKVRTERTASSSERPRRLKASKLEELRRALERAREGRRRAHRRCQHASAEMSRAHVDRHRRAVRANKKATGGRNMRAVA